MNTTVQKVFLPPTGALRVIEPRRLDNDTKRHIYGWAKGGTGMLIKMQRRLTLTTFTWIAWVAVGVDVGVDLLEPKSYQAVVAAVVALSIVAAARAHAGRVEAALQAHSDSMARHTFTLNQAFQLGLLSDAAARRDAAELHRPNGCIREGLR